MKRGESGLSLLVAVDKPVGMSSHDVVNRARRVFGERRVGHTGTLDPMASGVLPLCVGPATRLDQYMTGHDKSYRVDIAFGFETTTDDAAGEPTGRGEPFPDLFDEDFARAFVVTTIGKHEQVPPQYSAIKVGGKKAYEVARKGGETALEPRTIEVYDADLYECRADGATGMPVWSADFSVSKGTYIRALARDIGRALGCPAHVSALRRLNVGSITLDDCVSLETLELRGVDAALDPVAALGFRYAFCDDAEKSLMAGAKLPASSIALNEPPALGEGCGLSTCTSSVIPSAEAPHDGELASLVLGNRLKALYSFSATADAWKPACVFSTPIARN